MTGVLKFAFEYGAGGCLWQSGGATLECCLPTMIDP